MRNEAIKNARNTLKEKRVKALYEEAFKSSKNFTSQGYNFAEEPTSFKNFDIPPYQSFVDDDPEPAQKKASQPAQNIKTAIKLSAAKSAFRAATYLACFAAGIYTTLYWQDSHKKAESEHFQSVYISGLYPQFRIGTNYTLAATSLYAEPDTKTQQIAHIPAMTDVQSIKAQGDWLTVRYKSVNGWVQAKDFGFGSAQHAIETGCIGQPGIAPRHGQLIGKAEGNSRLRILNDLSQSSVLSFQSYDGLAPFSIYLRAGQAYAVNFIPQGHYRLVLETGSLYHHACNRFLFNDTNRIILDNVEFGSTEQSLTLNP